MTNMVKWYYDKKELRSPPSVQKGLPLDTEQRYRREGIRFIRELGSNMNLSPATMATASVYFHRFYMFHTFQDFPRYPTACACLFLAGKAEETPKKCRDVIKFAKDLLPETKFLQFGPEARNWTEEVMTLERILLQTIKFDLEVEHPYTFLVKYGNCLKGDKVRRQKMVQMAWTFVNDSLCTTLCLQWEPEIVAIAVMYLAGKLSKFDVVDWEGRRSDHLRWWDLFVQDMSIEILEEICHVILDMYSQSQPTPPDSPLQSVQTKANSTNSVPLRPTNVSPLANFVTPKNGGSKTSTPIENAPIIPPGVAGVPLPFVANPTIPPPTVPPPPFVMGNFSQPPPVAPPAAVVLPPVGFVPGVPPPPVVQAYYPPAPPPPHGRYQPPLTLPK